MKRIFLNILNIIIYKRSMKKTFTLSNEILFHIAHMHAVFLQYVSLKINELNILFSNSNIFFLETQHISPVDVSCSHSFASFLSHKCHIWRAKKMVYTEIDKLFGGKKRQKVIFNLFTRVCQHVRFQWCSLSIGLSANVTLIWVGFHVCD